MTRTEFWHAILGRVVSDPKHGPKKESRTMATVAKMPTRGQTEYGAGQWFDEAVERGKRSTFAEVATVTPSLANAILGRNEGNRVLREALIDLYSGDMAAGRWTFNGEPIIISNDGRVNDGQHRLHAIINANVSVPILFVFGPPFETRLTTNQGGTKTTGDYLSMEGIKNANIAAALTVILMSLENSGFRFAKDRFITKAQIRARVKGDDHIGFSAHYVTTVQRFTRGLLPPALIGVAHYLFSDIGGQEAAEEFLNQVCIGENIKRGDPAFAVRQSLSNLDALNRSERLEVLFRGWNAYRQCRKLTLAKALGTLPALV